ncbi:DUF4175 domain-containing protein [Hymenobacter sp. RP-2-7]|uniref:DUF4175 domain-containing protein n=1 Tax=Hymenobacter polaris TaxID=2682546 RepID=A0A7Y0FN22_9BACT|nr:DUF4175 family protein [Hymenobacter polaris]NML66014.1 DUF4175 domain-containing protein [Hymenobacter polaris]
MPTTATHPAALADARAGLHAASRSYARRYAVARLLPLLAAGGLLVVLALRWPAGWPLLLGLALASLAVVGWQLQPLRHWHAGAAAAALDRRYPILQDSTGLLLADETALPLLPGLQQQRVTRHFTELAATEPQLLPVAFKNSYLLSALLGLGALGVGLWPSGHRAAPAAAPVAVRLHPDPARPAGAPVGPARIEQVQLLVTPPAYTRRVAFGPAGASFSCPAGSRVRWLVRVSGAGAAPVLELGRRRLALGAAGQARIYAAEQVLSTSTLYRLHLAGQVSDDYAIEVQPDQAPTIRIQSPKPYTLIAARGTRPEVTLQATARDDYGLSQAELVLTVATGQGEAVKFRELRRELSAGLGRQPTQAPLGSLLRLPALGLHPGDELYLYLQARDNHGQRARSDTYLVQWQDTAAAASALDLGMGVNTAPAYFRSERQIIIDTEKLLAEQKKLTAAEFANRSNALGFDQQALRLRYGKFLGEEAEKGMGATAGPPTADEPALPTAEDATSPAPPAAAPAEPDDHDHDHAAVGTRPNDSPTAATDALMEPYIHKHDDAETADFLEPAVKAKLHAVLDEMWAAELRLRTNQPAAARPYEYRALRLLKEVQQQTRAYVRKAGFTPTPLPEATLRLTGELKGAAALHEQATLPAPAAQPAVRVALRWLAAVRAGQPPRPADARLLEPAGAALAAVAVQQPALYLPALKALRTLGAAVRAGQPAPPAQLVAAEQGLSALLPAPVPAAAPTPAPNRLARRYFQELSE